MIKVKGFTLISALFMLTILSISAINLNALMHVLSRSNQINYSVGNSKDIYLLQYKLAFATDLESDGSALYFNYEDQDYTLKQIDDHLVLTPGAQYFALHVDAVNFYQNGTIWLMDITIDEIEQTIALAYED